MNGIHALFVTGGLLFWAVVALELFILVLLVGDKIIEDSSNYYSNRYDDTPYGTLATVSIAIFFGLMFVCGDWSWKETLSRIWNDPWWSLGKVGIYLAVGMVWSMFLTWFVAWKRGEPYRDAREQWLIKEGVTKGGKVPDNLLKDWQAYVKQNDCLVRLSVPVPVINQKANIIRRGAFWPFSILYFALANVVTEIFNFLFDQLRSVYETLVEKAHKDISDDFREVKTDD